MITRGVDLKSPHASYGPKVLVLLALGERRKCLEASFVGEGSPTCMMLLSPSPSCPGDADAAAAPPAEATIGLERRCPRARPPSPPRPPPFPPPGMLGARREECSATNATGGPAAVPPGAFALVPGVTGAAPGGDLAGGAPAEVEPSPRPSRASRASKRSSSCVDLRVG